MIEKLNEHVGTVAAVHGNNNYLVRFEMNGTERDVLCSLSGNMRRFKISVIVGDKVKAVIPPPFDRGRITFREKE